MIDGIDLQILNILQQNARVTNADIARHIGMAPSAVLERMRKLETRGLICGYEARLNPKELGLGLLAFIFVRTDEGPGKPETGPLLAEIPEVQEVHHIAGEDCYLVKIRTAFAAIYIIWGSTYLGIAIAIETMPPYLMAAARFLSGGTLMMGWAFL